MADAFRNKIAIKELSAPQTEIFWSLNLWNFKLKQFDKTLFLFILFWNDGMGGSRMTGKYKEGLDWVKTSLNDEW